MSDTPEELYEKYLYNNPDGQRAYEVITISHSQLAQTYNVVKEAGGLDVTFEDGSDVSCLGVIFDVERESSSDDLDVSFSIVFDDQDGLLKDEANNIDLTTDEQVVVEYRIFMSTDTSEPAYGPISLYANTLTATTDGQVTIVASAPSVTVNRCGELYTYSRFPMLKAYL
jgi:hypothetical protein